MVVAVSLLCLFHVSVVVLVVVVVVVVVPAVVAAFVVDVVMHHTHLHTCVLCVHMYM